MDKNRTNLLNDLIDRAKKLGADAADAVLFDSIALEHTHRLGRTEGITRAESSDLGLRVLVGERQAMAASTDLSPDALDQLAAQAVAMAKNALDDPWCGLADPGALAKDIPDLDTLDAEEPTPEILQQRAACAEDAARAIKGVTNSEGAEAGWSRTNVALSASNGFSGAYAVTGHSVAVSVLAGEGTDMQRDYDYDQACFGADLRDGAAIGKRAGERAVARLNPRKMATAEVPVIFDNRVSGSLLRAFAGAISGPSVARGTSFLKDKLNEKIFSDGINIIDDPRRKRGHRSKPFDGEGVGTTRQAWVNDGVLESWIMDCASARQLGLTTTGNAARGTSSPPSPSPTNLYMEAGETDVAALIADIEQGFLVTELMGMGVNGVTGDYSQGAAGCWIENGEIAFPVSELTVAANLKDMFLAMTPANDLVFRTGTDAPSLRIEGMCVAGA
ncbi:MAG: TldD/PmbA family protein [Rhodospirillales bacterium]|jgi:PmbA protein|nr:TldD/PmbA family protein [Rhodospirillales bacterium]MBT5075235.1 TldD/PmbA family protein [Rhodospirillales bacterium]MBT5113964.1 TldD/PmbA family protein [Rhodospirillales bacterium]MBT5672492.1 TldD/PmbA family protein [Rhodospirillales bacterium]MBT6185839.1 TldD/PmbA family protein [Rhodospirillales bacterium]